MQPQIELSPQQELAATGSPHFCFDLTSLPAGEHAETPAIADRHR